MKKKHIKNSDWAKEQGTENPTTQELNSQISATDNVRLQENEHQTDEVRAQTITGKVKKSFSDDEIYR